MDNTQIIPDVAVEDLVLAQTTASTPIDALLSVGRECQGLVLSDVPGVRQGLELRQRGFRGPLVLDLLNVDWQKSPQARAKRERAWRDARSGDFTLVVTPSRRIPPGSRVELEAHLDEADGLLSREGTDGQQAMLGLSLDARWLDHASSVELLARHLRRRGSPAVIALAAAFDPLGTTERVRCLRQLLESVDLALTRSDLAGLGAWAYGARFVGIGLSSTVRHLPIPLTAHSRHRDRTPHVLIPGSLAWVKGSALHFAGDHPSLRCGCPICQQASLARLGDGQPHRRQEALLHSFYVWQHVAHHLAGAAPTDRRFAWHRTCKDAYDFNERFADDTGVRLSRQPLRSWMWL